MTYRSDAVPTPTRRWEAAQLLATTQSELAADQAALISAARPFDDRFDALSAARHDQLEAPRAEHRERFGLVAPLVPLVRKKEERLPSRSAFGRQSGGVQELLRGAW